MPDIKTVKDPVCGMQIEPHTAAVTEKYEGEMYYFCSRDCRNKFVEEPPRYMHKEAAA